MSILRFNTLPVIGALFAATFSLACTTPAHVTPIAMSEHPTLSALPALEPGQGRIVLYRQAKAEGPSHALIMIDSESTFDVRPGRFAHRDVAPGEHIVEVVLVNTDYTKLVTTETGRRLGKRVLSHRLYGKPIFVDIGAGETTYVEVSVAGVGISSSGVRSAAGAAAASGSGSGGSGHIVTLTPDYHSASEVPGLRYRVLFPSLVGVDAGAAQAALRHATRCGTECVVPPRIAELATSKWRSSPIAASTSPATRLKNDGSTAELDTGSEEAVSWPAAPSLE